MSHLSLNHSLLITYVYVDIGPVSIPQAWDSRIENFVSIQYSKDIGHAHQTIRHILLLLPYFLHLLWNWTRQHPSWKIHSRISAHFPSCPCKAKIQRQSNIQNAAASLFASTLVDDGPNPHSQLSRLWSSHEGHQSSLSRISLEPEIQLTLLLKVFNAFKHLHLYNQFLRPFSPWSPKRFHLTLSILRFRTLHQCNPCNQLPHLDYHNYPLSTSWWKQEPPNVSSASWQNLPTTF